LRILHAGSIILTNAVGYLPGPKSIEQVGSTVRVRYPGGEGRPHFLIDLEAIFAGDAVCAPGVDLGRDVRGSGVSQ
jgi:hypothetical protein